MEAVATSILHLCSAQDSCLVANVQAVLLETEAAVQTAAASQAAADPESSQEGTAQAGADLELRATLALAQRRCAHLRCTNLAGASEAELWPRRCGGCGAVRYCIEACSRAHWRAHRAVCRRLQAQRGAVG